LAEVKKDISMMRGIIPSLHTPFNKKNKIDIPSLRKLIDHTIATGCSGMLVGAVAGENSSLTFDEKNILLNECVTYNKNRIPIIVSCTAKNQKERITLSRNAKELGADWILCQTPENIFGNELVECFNEIAENGPDNLMIQDLSWTDYGMRDEDILILFKNIDKFKSLKIEVLNSGPKYTKILDITNQQLHLSGGWAIMGMIEALNRGVHAFIPSTMEVIYNKIYNLYSEKKIENARTLFAQIMPVLSFTHQHIDISIKFSKMLRVKEEIFNTNFCREPIKNFDQFQTQEANLHIRKVLDLQNSLNNN
jgi:4-hydroxy-tetrahydrodipicolinate synthase